MKKYNTIIIVLAAIIAMSSCSTVYNNNESKSLYPYLETENLLKLTQEADPDILIVDLRSAEEYAAGHIPTAQNYHSAEIMERLDELPKERYYIFYCKSGGNAHAVVEKLQKKGYRRIINWGGILRWPYELEKL